MTRFSTELAITLTGATANQLASWRSTNLLLPEGGSRPRVMYSFRDLVALRMFVKLRVGVSLQKVRKALNNLRNMDLTEHPSQYALGTDGASVYLFQTDDPPLDLVKHPGHQLLITLDDAFHPFKNFQGREVVNFRNPRERLEIREQRMSGWPTIAGTRLPFDEIANQVGPNLRNFDLIQPFYPGLTRRGAADALSFEEEVESFRPRRRASVA